MVFGLKSSPRLHGPLRKYVGTSARVKEYGTYMLRGPHGDYVCLQKEVGREMLNIQIKMFNIKTIFIVFLAKRSMCTSTGLCILIYVIKFVHCTIASL